MKKIYFMAANWDWMRKTKQRTVVQTECLTGSDVANFTESFKYSDGWRIYAYTTKRERDCQVEQALRKA